MLKAPPQEFTKELTIKQLDLVVFPNTIEFLNITNIDRAAKTKAVPSNPLFKSKGNPVNNSFPPKPKRADLELEAGKLKEEIDRLEKSIKLKEGKSISKGSNEEKDLKKIAELESSIRKWKEAGQEAMIELQKTLSSQNDQKVALKDVIYNLKIDPKLFSFAEENDCFDDF